MSECMRCRVSGRVQGVFFRASTLRMAQELGVTGWVRNLPDGSVEVLACGESGALDAMREWLKQGPRMAQVSQVECEPAAESPPPGFDVL